MFSLCWLGFPSGAPVSPTIQRHTCEWQYECVSVYHSCNGPAILPGCFPAYGLTCWDRLQHKTLHTVGIAVWKTD